MSHHSLTPSSHSRSNQWPAVFAIALATFVVITTEMLPIGILNTIATSLDSSTGTAGLSVSLPAILGGFVAPLVLLMARRIDRKKLICGLLCLLIIANLATAFAPSMAFLLLARLFVGFAIGGIWSIAGGVASRLVHSEKVGLATSIIVGGVAAASVLGVPLGTIIGDLLGWRPAFIAMSLISLIALFLNGLFVPKLPVSGQVSITQYHGLIKLPKVIMGLLLTLCLVTSHFMAFTFIRPIALDLLGFQIHWLSGLLLAYGGIGMLSNLLIGYLNPKKITTPLLWLAGGLTAVLIGLNTNQPNTAYGLLLLLVWGAAYGGVSITLMTWMIQAAPKAIEAVTSLYIMIFYISIAAGAFFGGLFIDALSIKFNLLMACSLSLMAFVLAVRLKRCPT